MTRISLDLSNHCVQTETKRVYNRLLSDCLKSKEIDPGAEEKVEVLKHALENFDFSALRTQDKALAGGTEAEVALVQDDKGEVFITVDEKPIIPDCL